MKRKTKIALALACIPVVFSGFSNAATVVIQTALSSGAAPSVGLVPISTGAIRSSGTAQPTNGAVSGSMNPQVSGTPSSTAREEGPSSGRPAASEEGPSSGRQSAASEEGGKRAPGTSSRTARTAGAAPSSKDAAPEIVYADPGAFTLTAEGGYASKHIWRGIDIPQFTSYRDSTTPKADSDVLFLGIDANYQGFSLGLKYIETLDSTFNPFFTRYSGTLDSYSELVLSLNYTRMLVGTDLLQATFGFDFYFYPNAEFWGVRNQGMFYARFSSPHYKWAQPFLEIFYNIATDTTGHGYYSDTSHADPFPYTSWRGAEGSELVEGGGFELGVNGGDRIFSNDRMSFALTYSLSTFYKTGYAFEDDGFSHIVLTIGAPLTIGSNFTITPSISYVQELGDISGNPNAVWSASGSQADIWNAPGWVAAVKASYRF
jgi:hypothetical protein